MSSLAAAPGWQPGTLRSAPGSGEVVLHLERGEELSGRVITQDGTPLKGTWFSIQPVSAELKRRLQDWQQRSGNAYRQGLNTNTDANGKFKFVSLMPGSYKPALRSADGVAPNMLLQTGSGPVTIQLMQALSISGVVMSPGGGVPKVEGSQRIYVNAYRKDNNAYLGGSQASSDDGSFVISNLPPGEVKLQVWAGRRYKSVSAFANAGDQSVSVTLESR